jgi:DNA-binding beta-propeller fold protein YncE
MFSQFVTLSVLAGLFGGAAFTHDDFLTLSSRLSPEVRMAVRQEKTGYRVRVEAVNPYGRVTAKLGMAAGTSTVIALDRMPAERLITAAEIGQGATLRLALEVSWFNADGTLRQREVFRAPAVGSRLPEDVRQWTAFDYAEYRERVADLAQRIRIPIRQPMDGKLSVVIEAEEGRRVRNLISGQDAAAGAQTVEWDGRDEVGNLVAPGTYRFRTASHPGITPEYKMTFANGGETFFSPFGSNHGTMTALAANSALVFAAAPITEGGWAIIALAPDGSFVRGYRQVGGAGIEHVFLAADEKRLYVLNDGGAWGGRGKAPALTLTVYDIATGDIVSLKGNKGQYAVLRERDQRAYKPGEKRVYALAGAVCLGGRLYVSDQEKGCVLVVDPETRQTVGEIPLPQAGVLAADGQRLVAASGQKLVTIDPASKAVTPLLTVPFVPRGLCLVRTGEDACPTASRSLRSDKEAFCVTGHADSTIKVYGWNGKLVKTLGEPGGAYEGAWRPERLVEPVGVTVAPDGALWVAEDRRNPKRLSKWSLATGRCVYDKVGCPAYGSPGAGFDSDKPECWFGQRCQWTVDQATGQSRIVSVLQKQEGHVQGKIEECLNYTFVHQGGRTFVLGTYKGTLISELMPDGSLKDRALISDVHGLLYGLGWKRVPAFCDTVEKRFPKASYEQKYAEESCRYVGVLWVDADDDGDFDAEEFQFLPAGSKLSSFGWGLKLNDLTVRVPYRNEKNEEQILTLSPDGFNACGAPAYSFEKALAKAAPLKDDLPQGSRTILDTTLNDARGNVVVNTDPFLFSIAENGTVNWLYPNRWTNVHGSHKAPLPKPGELQGVLFGLGTAPLDRQGDVMVFVGNHGRFFLITTDGIYLDEMFQDCRVAEVVGPGLIGGEAFGGSFGYDRVNKRYVLQAGSSGYRIYHLKGLDRVQRNEGTVKVTPEMLASAVRRSQGAARSDTAQKQAALTRLPEQAKVTFGALPVAAEWSSGNWNIRVRGGYDAQNLYVQYDVADPSPWVNNGKDWTQLFKTGDCVDLQLGADVAAPATRKSAAPGDLRLSIAPFSGRPLAVLYRYRLKDKAGANPVEFASPWRSEKVDDVCILERVKVQVQTSEGGYRLEATIPLSDLGLGKVGGQTLRGDFGVIYGDRLGTVNLSRVYWSNPATGLVNDVPGETMLAPDLWGSVKFGE